MLAAVPAHARGVGEALGDVGAGHARLAAALVPRRDEAAALLALLLVRMADAACVAAVVVALERPAEACGGAVRIVTALAVGRLAETGALTGLLAVAQPEGACVAAADLVALLVEDTPPEGLTTGAEPDPLFGEVKARGVLVARHGAAVLSAEGDPIAEDPIPLVGVVLAVRLLDAVAVGAAVSRHAAVLVVVALVVVLAPVTAPARGVRQRGRGVGADESVCAAVGGPLGHEPAAALTVSEERNTGLRVAVRAARVVGPAPASLTVIVVHALGPRHDHLALAFALNSAAVVATVALVLALTLARIAVAVATLLALTLSAFAARVAAVVARLALALRGLRPAASVARAPIASAVCLAFPLVGPHGDRGGVVRAAGYNDGDSEQRCNEAHGLVYTEIVRTAPGLRTPAGRSAHQADSLGQSLALAARLVMAPTWPPGRWILSASTLPT